jgi:TPR repeat protein
LYSNFYLGNMRKAAILIFTLLSLCAVSQAAPVKQATAAVAKGDSFVRGAPLPAWALPTPEIPFSDRPDPIVQRLHDTQAWLGGAEPAVLHSIATQVNEQSQLAVIGQVALPFVPAYQKILVHKVAILRGSQSLDRMSSVSLRVVEQENQFELGAFGLANLQLVLQDVRVGDTLVLSYTIQGSNPVFGGRWSHMFPWEGAPTELRRLVVTHAKQRPLYWQQLGDFKTEALRPQIEQVGQNERMTFVERRIEGVESEPGIPSDYLPLRMLQFSEFKDWREVSAWAHGMFPQVRPGAALKSLAQTFASEPTQAAKATAALRWVQSEVRYYSVSLGENSHRPHAPDTVLADRYGDCKDKSYLLISLLGQMGIDASPVLVSARLPRLPSRLQPSPAFDHVIVRLTIDGKDYFVDPTVSSEKGPLTNAPVAMAGAYGLVADGASTALIQIPESAGSAPLVEISETVNIPAVDGAATMVARMAFRGALAAGARFEYRGTAAAVMKRKLLARYEKAYPGVSLTDTPVVADEGSDFVVTAKFSLPRPLFFKDHRYEFPFMTHLVDTALAVPDKASRNFPYAYAAGKLRTRYHLKLNWPPEARLNLKYGGRLVDSRYFRASDTLNFMGGSVEYSLDFQGKSERVETHEMVDFQEQIKRLRPMSVGVALLPEFALTKEPLLGYSAHNLQMVISLYYLQDRVTKLAGRKMDTLEVQEVCDIARNFGSVSESLSTDLRRKLAEVDTNLASLQQRPGMKECLGYSLLLRGQYKSSVSYLQAAALPDLSPYLPYLAWSRFETGDTEGAVRDYQRVFDAQKKAGTLHAALLANYVAIMQRAGKEVPADVFQDGVRDPRGAWPLPVLAMQADALSPEDLLKIVESMPADARELALDQAWFYIGQRALAKGDKPAAERAFSWFKRNSWHGDYVNAIGRSESVRLAPRNAQFDEAVRLYSSGDRSGYFRKLPELAQSGFAEAQFSYGLALFAGTDVKMDKEAALAMFQAAAAQGHGGSIAELGGMYERGNGVEKDAAKAVQLYQQSADMHDARGLYYLGRAYHRGVGVKVDDEKSRKLLQQAADMSWPRAMVALGEYYAAGIGGKIDYAQASYWGRRAWDKEFPAGAVLLGRLMRDGLGMTGNATGGAALFRLAADKGSVDGRFQLGLAYVNGRGLAKDVPQGVRMIREAAEKGALNAQEYLAAMYERGNGVTADKEEAARWYRKAAENGSASASRKLSAGGEVSEPSASPAGLE